MLMYKGKLQFFVPAFPLILYTKHKTCHNLAKKHQKWKTRWRWTENGQSEAEVMWLMNLSDNGDELKYAAASYDTENDATSGKAE